MFSSFYSRSGTRIPLKVETYLPNKCNKPLILTLENTTGINVTSLLQLLYLNITSYGSCLSSGPPLIQVKKIMERPKVGLWDSKCVVHEMQFMFCLHFLAKTQDFCTAPYFIIHTVLTQTTGCPSSR